MGASSARFAAGWLDGGRIRYEVVEQLVHEPVEGRWDYAALMGLCKRAVSYAQENFEKATLGIDTWGVDHGFLDGHGRLTQDPVAYRDPSHSKMYDEMVRHRKHLFELTGIQHQPFNTIYQLAARAREHPDWPTGTRWQLLPDLFGHELTKRLHYEYTQCSTTQLMGLDGKWCDEAFELAGWPTPLQQPRMPGQIVGPIVPGVDLASVASHDTASAVCGLGSLQDDDVFLNVGTWTLLGTVIEQPLVSHTAEDGGWTNERTYDGRVRFLKNIPGFYIINRLFDEIGEGDCVASWLERADFGFDGHFDYFHRDFYNPERMSVAVLERSSRTPTRSEHWAAMALRSMADATVGQPSALGEIVGRQFTRMRVAGGGSQSDCLCQALADGTGLQVVAGPAEATVLGNLAVQMAAAGEIAIHEIPALVDASIETRTFEPGAGR
jgi:rhamnulokinase